MRIEDTIAIHQLLAFYGHAVDHVDQSLLHQVFTDDGVFDGRPCGSELIEGLKAIEAFFALGKPPHPGSHHTTNIYAYEVDGRTFAKSKFLFRHPVDRSICLGDYDDELERTADGWRISRRVVRPTDPLVQPGAEGQ